MKYLSLFSGIGGFELGIKQAYETKNNNIRPDELENSERPEELYSIENKLQQWECVGYSEIDKYAIQIYQKHFNHKNYGDITNINVQELPDFDLLVGGFPCQSFSIAGRRLGFDDTRGTLFFDIARILSDKRPRYLVLENVKGLLSHDKGKTFQTILGVLSDLGYRVEWQILNSKHFNIPQNRERVFIVGHLRGESGRQIFPITSNDTKTTGNIKVIKNSYYDTDRLYSPNGISRTLRANAGGKGAKTGLYMTGIDLSTQEAKITKQARTLQARYHKGYSTRKAETTGVAVLTPDRINKRQNGRRFKENGEPSFTLTGQDRHGIYDGTKIRRLTPTECERLQGFPDGWTETGNEKVGKIGELDAYTPIKISDTQRYKTLGNAVTVNVIKAICQKLLNTKNGVKT